MKKILRIVGAVLLVLILLYIGACAIAPAQPIISVTQTLKSPPVAVYNQFSDYKKWEAWSIWHNSDPTMKITYPGTTNEVGSKYSWSGKEMGKGSQEIKELVPYQKMRTEMRFEGFDMAYYADVLFKESGTGTEATWTMSQEKPTPFLYRGMSMMMNGTLKQQFIDNFKKVDSVALLASGNSM
jgi:hypothetical protein